MAVSFEELMGSKEREGYADEKPAHRVTLRAYAIDRTEVTVAAYRQCVEAGKCGLPNQGGACNWGIPDRAQHPVSCVDWDQAAAYCQWKGKRLPTEAAWEYAARGGDGRTYPWGNEIPADRLCWRGEANDRAASDRAGTCPAGAHPAGVGPFGPQDMAGNVREWVGDWFGDYPREDQSDPRGPASGSSRVRRGGGWANAATEASEFGPAIRAAIRNRAEPGARSEVAGFRCAAPLTARAPTR